MAIKEYIGARYVPMFYDDGHGGAEWTDTVQFEPLTIVQHDGNSYTSRQYVPIGIDILNTEYWLQTGNWNSQVEQYRQEVLNFDERITAAQNTAEDAGSAAATAQATAEAAATAAGNAQTAANNAGLAAAAAQNTAEAAGTAAGNAQTAANNAGLAAAAAQNTAEAAGTAARNAQTAADNAGVAADAALAANYPILCIGDSWGAAKDGWVYHLKQFGCFSHVYDKCEPGCGLVRPNTGQNHTLVDLFRIASEELSTEVKQSIRRIIIAGGLNDCHVAATIGQLQTACQTIATLAAAEFPNALVLLAGINLSFGHDLSVQYTVRRGWQRCGRYPNMAYITNSEYIAEGDIGNIDPTSTGHLVSLGYNTVASYLAEAIRTGTTSANFFSSINFTPKDNYVIAKERSEECLNDDLLTFTLRGFTFNFPDTITLAYNEWTEVGVWASSIACGQLGRGNDIRTSMACLIRIPTSGASDYRSGTCNLRFANDGKVYIRVGANGATSISGISHVYLLDTVFALPTFNH